MQIDRSHINCTKSNANNSVNDPKKRRTEQGICDLSEDVLSRIFSYLAGKEQINRLSLVNRHFQNIFNAHSPFGHITKILNAVYSHFYSNKTRDQSFPPLAINCEIPSNYELCSLDLQDLQNRIESSLKKLPNQNGLELKDYKFKTIPYKDYEVENKKVKESVIQFTHCLIKELFQQHSPLLAKQLLTGFFWDFKQAIQVSEEIFLQNEKATIPPYLLNIQNIFECIDHINPTIEMIEKIDWSECYKNQKTLYGARVLGEEFLNWFFEQKDLLATSTCDSLFQAVANLYFDLDDCYTDDQEQEAELAFLENYPYLFEKRSFVLTSVGHRSYILKRASLFHGDREVVLAAIENSNAPIECIDPILYEEDREVLKKIFLAHRKTNDSLPFTALPMKFRADREIAILACQNHQDFYDNIDENFKIDEEFHLEVFCKNLCFKKKIPEIASSDAFLLKAFEKHSANYIILPDHLKDNEERALKYLATAFQSELRFIPKKFLHFDFYQRAVSLNIHLIDYLEFRGTDITSFLIKSRSNILFKLPLRTNLLDFYYREIKKDYTVFSMLMQHFENEVKTTDKQKKYSNQQLDTLILTSIRYNPYVLSLNFEILKHYKNIYKNQLLSNSIKDIENPL